MREALERHETAATPLGSFPAVFAPQLALGTLSRRRVYAAAQQVSSQETTLRRDGALCHASCMGFRRPVIMCTCQMGQPVASPNPNPTLDMLSWCALLLGIVARTRRCPRRPIPCTCQVPIGFRT